MDDRMLDGNAAAGLLQEVFADDVTSAMGTCGQCGASQPMGAAHAFQGAGIVLRCPHCEHVLVKIVRGEARVWIGFPGALTMEVPVATT